MNRVFLWLNFTGSSIQSFDPTGTLPPSSYLTGFFFCDWTLRALRSSLSTPQVPSLPSHIWQVFLWLTLRALWSSLLTPQVSSLPYQHWGVRLGPFFGSLTIRAPCTPLPRRLGAYSARSTRRSHSMTRPFVHSKTSAPFCHDWKDDKATLRAHSK